MSDIHFDCPHCQAHIEADEAIRGQRVSCPKCRRSLIVPAKGMAASDAPSQPAPASAPTPNSGAFPNSLGSDFEIKGTLRCQKAIRFDGQIVGQIFAENAITIGPNAKVQGDVHARAITLQGAVKGNLAATERCELKADSELVGHLKSPKLSMEEGAVFSGRSEITPHPTSIPKADAHPSGSQQSASA